MPGKLVSRMSKRECFTLSEKDTVKSASQKFHEKKIGCMPVINENKTVTGILSERDLSRFIYAEKFNLTLPVSELMSKSLVTCDLNTSVTELMDEMTERKIRHILIMDDKKLLGIVSIGDFGTILFFQLTKIPFPVLAIMVLAIINGIITSIILETIILLRQNFSLKLAFQTAVGMSLISMVSMEIAMNATDYLLTGGAILTWWVVPIMLFVGFVTPWPYNYWRLKKFNEACH